MISNITKKLQSNKSKYIIGHDMLVNFYNYPSIKSSMNKKMQDKLANEILKTKTLMTIIF